MVKKCLEKSSFQTKTTSIITKKIWLNLQSLHAEEYTLKEIDLGVTGIAGRKIDTKRVLSTLQLLLFHVNFRFNPKKESKRFFVKFSIFKSMAAHFYVCKTVKRTKAFIPFSHRKHFVDQLLGDLHGSD